MNRIIQLPPDSLAPRVEILPDVWLDARRAVWLSRPRLLVVADLHWGYAASHRAEGNLLPIWGDDEIAARLRALLADYRPAGMLWLGDSLHTLAGRAAAEAFLRSMVGDRLWDRMPSAMRAERRAEGVALVADLQMCRRPEAEVDFHAVVRPTLLGCGAASAERFRWSARHLLEALPDAMLVEVAESQHGAHLSHPTEFAAFAAAARARGTQPGHGSRGEG